MFKFGTIKNELYEEKSDEPPQLPVTILDMERTNGIFDMNHHTADPCPECGAFNMKVGDWVCWGHCFPCEIKDDAERT